MAKVTLGPKAETPTEAVVNAANATVMVTDAKGRQITVKKIGALDRMRLFELIGPDNVKNEAYLGYATLAYAAVKIDGEDVPRPTSKLALEGLVQRLDDDGLASVAKAIAKNFMPPVEDIRDKVKNG
jgi:hypothetical protein